MRYAYCLLHKACDAASDSSLFFNEKATYYRAKGCLQAGTLQIR